MTPAIVSRCRVFEFRRLTEEDIKGALKLALTSRKGLAAYKAEVDEDAIGHIARMSAGDLRTAYNALELAVLTTPPGADGRIHVTLSDAEQSIQRKLSHSMKTRITICFRRFARVCAAVIRMRRCITLFD